MQSVPWHQLLPVDATTDSVAGGGGAATHAKIVPTSMDRPSRLVEQTQIISQHLLRASLVVGNK